MIAVLAIGLRLPSCAESYWVDELHSAWCVSETLQEVAPRAIAGNQSPIYFIGLFLWNVIVGDSEWWMRLSSVLAYAAACVALGAGLPYVMQGRHRDRMVGGLTAGLLLAFDRNGLFFGTELRPFAWVILASSIASLSLAELLRDRHTQPRLRTWTILFAAIVAAAALQPTSIAALGWLPLAAWIARYAIQPTSRERTRPGMAFGFAIVAGVCLWLAAGPALQLAWQNREQWRSVGAAVSLTQCWQVWPWLTTVILPLTLATISRAALWRRRGSEPPSEGSIEFRSAAAWWLATVAILATLTFWLLAWLNVAPLFHRRYFIAVLPLLPAVAGLAVTDTLSRFRGRRVVSVAAWALPTILAVSMMIEQGFPNPFRWQSLRLVHRGEDWRGALEHLRRHRVDGQPLWLSPGLIETERLLATGSHTRKIGAIEYLTYPISGPYRESQRGDTRDAEVFSWRLRERPPWQKTTAEGSGWAVVRAPATSFAAWISRYPGLSWTSFGGVQVIRWGNPAVDGGRAVNGGLSGANSDLQPRTNFRPSRRYAEDTGLDVVSTFDRRARCLLRAPHLAGARRGTARCVGPIAIHCRR